MWVAIHARRGTRRSRVRSTRGHLHLLRLHPELLEWNGAHGRVSRRHLLHVRRPIRLLLAPRRQPLPALQRTVAPRRTQAATSSTTTSHPPVDPGRSRLEHLAGWPTNVGYRG